MILRGEGEKASRVLRAEGERMALILRALGEAQRLRILTAAPAAMTPRALSILAMETLQELGRCKATKIVVPYEVKRLLEALSSHLAEAAEKPQPGRTDVEVLQGALQRLEQLLGPLPRSEDLMSEVKRLQEAEQLRRQSPHARARFEVRHGGSYAALSSLMLRGMVAAIACGEGTGCSPVDLAVLRRKAEKRLALEGKEVIVVGETLVNVEEAVRGLREAIAFYHGVGFPDPRRSYTWRSWEVAVASATTTYYRSTPFTRRTAPRCWLTCSTSTPTPG